MDMLNQRVDVPTLICYNWSGAREQAITACAEFNVKCNGRWTHHNTRRSNNVSSTELNFTFYLIKWSKASVWSIHRSNGQRNKSIRSRQVLCKRCKIKLMPLTTRVRTNELGARELVCVRLDKLTAEYSDVSRSNRSYVALCKFIWELQQPRLPCITSIKMVA